ncbi:MAG: DUF1579 domain-containing protein [Planctomycetota bacterium]
MKHSLPIALLLAALVHPTFAQDVPKPGAEHQKLAARAGTWNAVVEMMGEDGTPSKSKATSVVKVACGGLWLLDEFHGEMMGMKFEGHGTTGYDPAKGKYVGTWIDSWSTSVMSLEGSYDKDGKVLTMSGMAPGMDGKPTLHRMTTTHKDANTDVFEMFMPGPDGKEMKILTITYTRSTEKSGAK